MTNNPLSSALVSNALSAGREHGDPGTIMKFGGCGGATTLGTSLSSIGKLFMVCINA
jgi:hypothetical protein